MRLSIYVLGGDDLVPDYTLYNLVFAIYGC